MSREEEFELVTSRWVALNHQKWLRDNRVLREELQAAKEAMQTRNAPVQINFGQPINLNATIT
jgi:hypothetical protein